MLSSPVLAWTLTLVFAVTGTAALVRLVRRGTVDSSDGPLVELAHLLMSVAMVAMVWGHGGGPGTALGAAQIVLFALLAVPLLISAARRGRGHGRVGDACHLLTTLAMVWMVAATPVLMGSGAGGMAGMAGMADMTDSAPATGAGWIVVDVVMVIALVLVAARWAARARVLVPAGRRAACHLLMSLGMASMLVAML